jgi:phage shock protein A
MRLPPRIGGLMTADLDRLLAQVDDPELVIAQLICEMEESIVDLRREAVTAVARQSRLRKRLFAAEEASRGVELEATLVWKRGDEIQARQILGRKILALKSRDALAAELAEANACSAGLVASLIRMEDRAQLARRKRDDLVRRRRAAEPARRPRALHAPSTSSVFDGYAAAVSALEVEAASDRRPDEASPGGGDVDGGGRC